MLQLIGFDLSEYFDVQVNQKKLRLDRAWEPNHILRNFSAQQDILVGLEYFLYPEPQRNRILEVFKDKNPVAHTCLTVLRERVAQTTIKTPTDLFHVAEQMKSHTIKDGEKNAIGQLNLMWKALDIQFIGANPAPPSIMTNYLS
jgi:hypothetical protein